MKLQVRSFLGKNYTVWKHKAKYLHSIPTPQVFNLEYKLYNVYSYEYIYELQLVFQTLQKEILRSTPCSNNHKLII